MQGVVKFFKKRDAWGFVIGSDAREFFFHISDWQSDTNPVTGMAVTFDAIDGPKGPKAAQVKPTGEPEAKTDIAWLRERS